jgi:AmmeMemoRadiSam system protein B
MLFVRPPVAAGSFYDIDPDRLKKQIGACFKKAEETSTKKTKAEARKFNAAVVPHAGYEYSGWVAAKFYSLLAEKPQKNYIILGPNHYLFGSSYAIMKSGLWKTPLGSVVIHTEMAEKLAESCKLLEIDVIPHQNEHSIEVQLPFLQYRFGDNFKFVPIAISNSATDETFLKSCQILGTAIADAIRKSKEKWVVVASSDFSHYVPQNFAEETDNYIIKSIVKLDEKAFFSRIAERNASVCGLGPIAIAMVAAKKLGSKKGELLKYATSGDVTGDISSVVGYASIAI